MSNIYIFLRQSRSYIYLTTLCFVVMTLMLTGFIPDKSTYEIRRPIDKDMPPPSDLPIAIRPENSVPWHILQKLTPLSKPSAQTNTHIPTYLTNLEQEALDLMQDNTTPSLDTFINTTANTPCLPPKTRNFIGTTQAFERTLLPQSQCSPTPKLARSFNKRPNIRYITNLTLNKRAHAYQYWVKLYAKKYKLRPALVYAVIYAESSFNPTRISNRFAHGLMQVVPASAGKEVHKWLGLQGTPSAIQLLDPAINIKYGTSYLHLLLTRHLGNVENSLTREYCAIAAYNMGINAMLRVFAPTKEEAIQRINTMTPEQAYAYLQNEIPPLETRNYLKKVVAHIQYFTQAKLTAMQ